MSSELTRKASSEYYSMNRNITETKILPSDGHKPEFLFLGQEINNAVETEIICENDNLGFDIQVTMKDGNAVLHHNVEIIHWCNEGKWAFTLQAKHIPTVQLFPFKHIKRVEVIKSIENHPLSLNSKLKS